MGIRRDVMMAVLLAGIGMPAVAAADGRATHRALGPEWKAIPHERLGALRGGLRLPSGLDLSFGIERAVFVNGQLVASTRLSIPDVARMTPDEASALAALEQTMVVQVGGRNTYEPTGMKGVVVQNTLDGQAIQVMTTLDVGTGMLGSFQQFNAAAAMQAALNSAPGAL
jgi:hypothetical protein